MSKVFLLIFSIFCGIFDDFSKFFGTFYFEKSSNMHKKLAKNEEKPCSTCLDLIFRLIPGTRISYFGLVMKSGSKSQVRVELGLQSSGFYRVITIRSPLGFRVLLPMNILNVGFRYLSSSRH